MIYQSRYLKFGTGNEDNQVGAAIVTNAGWRGDVEAEELPLARLFVTILQRMGVETDTFAGYSGTLSRGQRRFGIESDRSETDCHFSTPLTTRFRAV